MFMSAESPLALPRSHDGSGRKRCRALEVGGGRWKVERSRIKHEAGGTHRRRCRYHKYIHSCMAIIYTCRNATHNGCIALLTTSHQPLPLIHSHFCREPSLPSSAANALLPFCFVSDVTTDSTLIPDACRLKPARYAVERTELDVLHIVDIYPRDP